MFDASPQIQTPLFLFKKWRMNILSKAIEELRMVFF
jgi:hypothetical protein